MDNAKIERFWWALKFEDIKIKEKVSFPQLHFGAGGEFLQLQADSVSTPISDTG